MEVLPTEIQSHIIWYCADKLTLRLVCKHWRDIIHQYHYNGVESRSLRCYKKLKATYDALENLGTGLCLVPALQSVDMTSLKRTIDILESALDRKNKHALLKTPEFCTSVCEQLVQCFQTVPARCFGHDMFINHNNVLCITVVKDSSNTDKFWIYENDPCAGLEAFLTHIWVLDLQNWNPEILKLVTCRLNTFYQLAMAICRL